MRRFVLAGMGTRVKDMQCWQCGSNIRPGQKLCVYCGAKLTADDDSAYEAPAQRGGSSGSGRDRVGGEREPRRSSGGGGSRGGRASEEDGWSVAPEREARSDRSGPRDRESYYQPNRPDVDARADSRSSRGPGGSRSSAHDPLDDPRAPRSLRGASSAGRSSERGRGRYESHEHDAAEYEYDDYNPRDRTSPRYQPRFDPESAEYDAVADQRRQSHLRPRSAESRSRAADWDDPRTSRSPRDGRPRDEFGRGQRDGGFGTYGGYGGDGGDESAEYPASYDERAGWRDRGSGPSRGGRGSGAADPQGYGGGWGQDQYEGRGAGGFNAPAAGGMGGPGARGWNDGAWAPPGAGYTPAGMAAPAKRRGRGGLIAAVIALVVVVLLAGGGYLARGEIRALLHRGGASNTPAPPAFATYTPGPTPTVLANYKLYSSANSKYVIEYPTAWSIQNQNTTTGGGYDYLDTFQQANPPLVVVVESAAAFNNLSDTDIINDEVTGAKQSGLTYKQVGSDVTTSIGGESWTRRDYTVTTSNGVTLHQAILVTHHAGHGYAIVLTSPASTFVQDDSGVFKTMLSTFRFMS